MKTYDFIAIGGGNAGLTATAKVKNAGMKVALVDRAPIGGLCSLNGCNPKKVLVRSTEVLEEVRRAAEYGIDVGEVRIDWPRVIDRKESFTSGVTRGSEKSLRAKGIDLITGSPQFVGNNELEIKGERFQAAGVLIATGSFPRPLLFKGGDLAKTSNDILALRRVPRRLLIIGAGAVAFEFGHVFARLGSRVTITTHGPRILHAHEEEMVRGLVDYSSKLGIELIVNARAESLRKNGDSLQAEFEVEGKSRRLEAEFVLNAAGRIPSIADLALETAGVQTDTHGVVVNEFLRSASNPKVLAAGDAHGWMQLSPIASYEGRVAARNFLEGDVERVNYDSVPRVLFTVPPLAAVGLSEAVARERGLNVTSTVSDMANWKVYAIAGEPVAKAKVILESGSGSIVGAHIFGAGAAEDIHIFALAIRFGITAEQLRNMVYAYPTFASALPYTLG